MADYTTHSFEDDHGPYLFTPRLDWLENTDTAPKWEPEIPAKLKLDEEGDPEEDHHIEHFIDMLSTPVGTLHWHMFCLSAYEYGMREGVERIGVSKVVNEVNARGNEIFMIEGVIKPENKAEVLIRNEHGTFMGRLFNYYHCFLLGRLPLFKLLPRRAHTVKCGACGAVTAMSGYVLEKPTERIDPDTWTFKDKLEDGGSNTSHGETKI